MCSRLTCGLLKRLPHPQTLHVGLAKLQWRYYGDHGDHPSEMDCATFKAYREQIAQALRKRKEAKKKGSAAKQVKKDAERLKKHLSKCIELKTKSMKERVARMSEKEKKAMGEMMDCVIAGIKSTCLKQVLQRYCKEQDLKRRYANLIKEKHIKDMIKKCAAKNKDSSGGKEEKDGSGDKCKEEQTQKAHEKQSATARKCEEKDNFEKCLAEVTKLLEADIGLDGKSKSKKAKSKDKGKENPKIQLRKTRVSRKSQLVRRP